MYENLGIKKSLFLYLITFLALAIASFFAISEVQAVEYGGFGGRPAFPREDNPRTESIFVHTLEPGEVKEDGVQVINNSDDTKVILVYAVDSTPSTGGAFACEQFSQPKDNVGAWIELEKTEVTLEPNTNELVPFTITVPENAGVGEHNGCIVIQEKQDIVVSDEPRSGVNLSYRTGLRVAVTIPGELERKLEIVDFSVEQKDDGNFLLKPKVTNTGNVSIDADVKVYTRSIFGTLIEEHGGEFPILRGETGEWNFELEKPFFGGLFYSELVVSYDESEDAEIGMDTENELVKLESEKVTFLSTPTIPGLLIEILVIVVIIIFIVFILRRVRRKRWRDRNWITYTVVEGEDLNQIAEKSSASWKLLASVNKLKPPYVLRKGDKIKIPPHTNKSD